VKTWKALLLVGSVGVITIVGWVALLTFAPYWAQALTRAIYVGSALAFAVILAVGLDEVFGHGRLRRAVQERLWPALKRLAIAAPLRGQRLPLGIAVMILLALILAVGLVAIITRDAAWTAGTAAVATMIVLAYQGWQIQESTAVGAQAIVVGQAAGIEAEKRRLDNRAPRIHVSIGEPAWPPGGKRPVTEAVGGGSPPQRLELVVPGSDPERLDEGHIFRLPRHANDPVCLWVEGEVLNEGRQTVRVHLRGLRISQPTLGPKLAEMDDRTPWSEPGSYFVSLGPGGKAFFRLEGARPVSDWVANHRALPKSGSDGSATARVADRGLTAVIKGEVEVDDGFDNGVTDTWQITIYGFPLQPVPDEDASWQVGRLVPEQPPVMGEVSQLRRTYWRSKQRWIELPSLEV
jgi:hypothetical protein